MKLWEYVRDNAIRGACTCGMCIDAPENPEKEQPEGHTIDMAFFKVAKSPQADAETFRSLVEAEYPHWLEGGEEERSFIQVGAEMGDQGIAIMTIALGDLLGVWKAITPERIGVPPDLALKMAGMGMLAFWNDQHSEGGN